MMKFYNSLFTTLVLLIPSLAVYGQDLRQEIIESLETYGIPSLSIGIIRNNELCWSEGFGYAEIETERPATDQTMYNLASLTKTFTATAAFQLIEKDSFALDDDINDYLDFSIRNPNFPETPITFRMLLQHTSSILVSDDTMFEEVRYGDPGTNSLENFVYRHLNPESETYQANNFTNNAPGSQYAYSNSAIALLGFLVEHISGMPFNEYCNTNIFEPLEMDNTRFFLSEIDTNQLARPYVWDFIVPQESVPISHYGYADYPDGLLRSSIQDLSKFLLMYMNDGTLNGQTILSSESIQTLVPTNSTVGHTWFRFDEIMPNNTPVWAHDGVDLGINTVAVFDNNRENGLIILCNTDKLATYNLPIWNKLWEYATGEEDCSLLTSTTSIDNDKSLVVSPNPSASEVSIQHNDNISEIQITNLDGKLIKNIKVQNQNTVQINIQDIPNGTYILTLINETGDSFIQKLTKIE